MNRSKKYILFREDDGSYILQKDFPHCIGKITKNKTDDVISQYPISGYRLYVNFCGTLRGNYATSDKFFVQESTSILSDMANFLLENKIFITDEYEKYKIRNADKQPDSKG